MKDQNLTFKDCEPVLYKWAWKFQGRLFEFWELVNEAWIRGELESLPKSKITLVSRIVRYRMIDYMRDETKNRRRLRAKAKGKPFPWMHNFSDISSNLRGDMRIEDLLANPHAEVIDVEQRDFVNFLINSSGLEKLEKFAMRLRFIAGLTQEEIGIAIGVCPSRVSQLLRNAIDAVKSKRGISNYEMEE